VFDFGVRMCGDPEDAKEVLQETLLAAARTVGTFRGGSSLPTWLYTIARSFCIKRRRRSKFAPPAEASLEGVLERVPSSSPGPDELAERGEVKRALASALLALDPASREVLVLRDMEGLTAPEVAEVTGSTVDAVKSRLHRARASVREWLGRALGEALPAPAPGCPDVLAAFSRELEGELDARRCAELQRHVDSCAACRGRCDSLRRSLAVCARVSPGPVPEAVKESVRAAFRSAMRGSAKRPGMEGQG
jgi:RNA polymerase sigma-70 factor (ECF subfamily)